VDDIITLKIEFLSLDGNGVGKHYEGKKFYSVFVAGTIPEETVRCRILAIKKLTGQAELIGILEASKSRKEAEKDEKLPGFDLVHIQYDKQLELKQKMVENVLRGLEVENVVASETKAYRDRTKLRLKKAGKKMNFGYLKNRSHDIVDVETCAFLNEGLNEAIRLLRDFFSKADKDLELSVELKLNHSNNKVICIFEGVSDKDFVEKMREFLDGNELFQNIVFLGEKVNGLNNEFVAEYVNNGTLLQSSFSSFTQVNIEINEKITAFIKQHIQPKKTESLLDLYCGIGNFSIPVGKFFAEVQGIDESESSIEDAKQNAKTNNVKNSNFSADSVENRLKDMKRKFDKIIMDPPRAGCENIVKQINKLGAKTIIYASCNPRTLVRDLKELKNYNVETVQPFDMFPYTRHIEVVVVLSKI
jgi:23S rRNA (uracil1939-C5)-methyltransferase